jgi:hypothetical protein
VALRHRLSPGVLLAMWLRRGLPYGVVLISSIWVTPPALLAQLGSTRQARPSSSVFELSRLSL